MAVRTAMLQLLHPISLNEKEPLRSACARVWRRNYESGGPLCCGGGPGDRKHNTAALPRTFERLCAESNVLVVLYGRLILGLDPGALLVSMGS